MIKKVFGYICGKNNKNYYKYEIIEKEFADDRKCSFSQWKESIYKFVSNNDIVEYFSSAFVLSGKKESFKNNDQLKKRFEKIDPYCVSHEIWDNLRFICAIRGELLLSHFCRQNAIKTVFSTKGYNSFFKRMSVLIEKNKYIEAKRYLKKCAYKPLSFTKTYKSYNKMLNVFLGEKTRIGTFAKYIENKRIVLLGPALDEKKYEDYNHSRDVIVRFTYRGKEFIPDANRQLPTNISYYNVETSEKLLQNNPLFINDLDFYCCRIKKIEKENPKGRYVNVFYGAIPFGIILSGQACILDLLQYNILQIYVTNFNLYYAKKKYANNYQISNKQNMFRTYAYHDIEGNFLLAKNLRDNGLIICDNELDDILNMSSYEYMLGLENLL